MRGAISKAGQLIGNNTSNLVENWMWIRTKFDGGKVIKVSPFLLEHSLLCSCPAPQLGHELVAYSLGEGHWQGCHLTNAPPLYLNQAKKVAAAKRSSQNPLVKQRARKRKAAHESQDTSKKAKASYGPYTTTACEDVSADTLEDLTSSFLKRGIAQ